MEIDNRVPLIRATGEFNHLTRSRLSEGPKRLDSPSLRLNSIHIEAEAKSIPDAKIISNSLTLEDSIKEISSFIERKYPKVINSPYSFNDVKILSNETHALAVTSEGYSIYIDITHNTFEEQGLSQHALASVILFKNDDFAFVKERDHGKIYLIELPSMKVKKTLKIPGEVTNGIGKMCLSPDQAFLYARLWKGEIVRWDLATLKDYQVMLVEKNVACMNLAPDGIFVVGTADKKLVLYSLKFEKIAEKDVGFVVDAYICFSDDGDFVLLGMAKSIKVFEKDTLELVQEVDVGTQANDVKITPDGKFIVAGLESGHLGFFSRTVKGKELRIKIHEAGIRTVHMTANLIYTFGGDSRLSHLNMPELSLFYDVSEIPELEGAAFNTPFKSNFQEGDDESFKALCVVLCEHRNQLIAAGESNKIYLFNADNLQLADELSGHQDYVFSLVMLNDRFLASGSADFSIIVWDLQNNKKKASLCRHFAAVSALCKVDLKKLASGSHDRSIKVWIWELEIMIYSISELPGPVVSLSLAKKGFLLAGFKELIQCWNVDSYSLVFEKSTDRQVQCFRMLEVKGCESSKVFYALGDVGNEFFVENPLATQKITCWGPDESRTYEFIAYVREIFSGKLPQYDSYMDFWMISPLNFNILHIYSYFNLHHYLAQSMLNGASLMNSSLGFNPLTIALDLKNKECVEVIIKAAWKQYQFNPHIFSCISSQTIQRLNSLDTYLLPKVYKLLTVPADYGRHFTSSSSLPQITLSFSNTLNPKSFLNSSKTIQDCEARFLQSSTGLFLNPGSTKSIKFLKSLLESKQLEVFSSELIQYILLFKWNTVKYFLYSELVIFVTYFIYLLIWMLFPTTSRETWIIASLGLVLFMFNVYTSVMSSALLIENCVDFLRTVALVLFLLSNELGIQQDFTQYAKMVTIFLSFLQGLTYFKLFSQTRHVIRTGLTLVKQSLSLVLLLFYILLVICILIYINQNSSKAPTLFLTTAFSELSEFFQVFFDYIVPGIIVVGLLAVSGNQIERDEAYLAAEFKELAKIVLKGENCLVWKRSKNWLEFVNVCTTERFQGTHRVKKIAKIVKEIKEGQDSQRFEMIEGFNDIRGKIEELSLEMKAVKKEKRHRKK